MFRISHRTVVLNIWKAVTHTLHRYTLTLSFSRSRSLTLFYARIKTHLNLVFRFFTVSSYPWRSWPLTRLRDRLPLVKTWASIILAPLCKRIDLTKLTRTCNWVKFQFYCSVVQVFRSIRLNIQGLGSCKLIGQISTLLLCCSSI